MFADRITRMSPGDVLLDAPIPDLVEQLAKSVASAQLALDATGVRVASMLSETKVDFRDTDGNVSSRSLLELGFVPTFYHFTEADIEVKMTVALKVESGFGAELDVDLGELDEGETNRAVPFGATLSLEYHSKYEFDVTGSSTVRTKMRAVPAPKVFLEAIQEHARAGGGSITGGELPGQEPEAPSEPGDEPVEPDDDEPVEPDDDEPVEPDDEE